MEANDKAFEKAKKNYITLMQIIDEYKKDEAETSKGLLYFLEGVIPELAITKYGKRIGMEALKEFFCNEVLQIHYGNRSFCEYENYFIKGDTDGYVFDVQHMNAYMDDKELSEYGNPKLLLQRLWQVAHKHLHDYFRCSAEENEVKRKNDSNKNTSMKGNRYCRFVMAAALYEIFVMKFLGDSSFEWLSEELEDIDFTVEEISQLFARRSEAEADMSEEGTKATLGKLNQAIDKMNRIKEAVKVAGRAAEYYRHIMYLSTFSMIIMLVEYNNVAGGIRYDKRKEISKPAMLECIIDETVHRSLYMQDVKLNKGSTYSELYRVLIKTSEQNKIVQELCGNSEKVRERALSQIMDYFHKIKDGEYMNPDGGAAEDFTKTVMQIAMKCVEMK